MRSEKHGPDRFAKNDKNEDGSLDIAELAATLPEVDWWKFSRKSAAEWFKDTDKDGSGSLSVTEFADIAGENHSEARFNHADQNKDGKLDAAETAAYIKGVLDILSDEELLSRATNMKSSLALTLVVSLVSAAPTLADAPVRFPGGRIAVSCDGNMHDKDDIGATAIILAMVRAAGLGEHPVK